MKRLGRGKNPYDFVFITSLSEDPNKFIILRFKNVTNEYLRIRNKGWNPDSKKLQYSKMITVISREKMPWYHIRIVRNIMINKNLIHQILLNYPKRSARKYRNFFIRLQYYISSSNTIWEQ